MSDELLKSLEEKIKKKKKKEPHEKLKESFDIIKKTRQIFRTTLGLPPQRLVSILRQRIRERPYLRAEIQNFLVHTAPSNQPTPKNVESPKRKPQEAPTPSYIW